MGINEMAVRAIRKLPISIISRMKLERVCSKVVRKEKAMMGLPIEFEIPYLPLVWNNRLYGNEFLLRRYAGLTGDLYSIIEHGLFFGRNSAKISLKHEWELGCILTGGNYRKDLIKEHYPDFYCETIGPMIYCSAAFLYFRLPQIYGELISPSYRIYLPESAASCGAFFRCFPWTDHV